MFHTDTAEQRETWVNAILTVAEALTDRKADPDALSVSQLPLDKMDSESLTGEERKTVEGEQCRMDIELILLFRGRCSTRNAIQ